jgi:peroxiredoxin
MRFTITLAAALLAVAAVAHATAVVGQAAPSFTLKDQDGAEVDLAKLRGKIVVLEWTNPDCPFAQRHAEANTMSTLADRYRGRGVVWLGVDSTSYLDAARDRAWRSEHHLPYPVLDDHAGQLGTAYGARTTPHMFVIDGKGTVVYAGAIDDDAAGDKGKQARNYVADALDEVTAGQPVKVPETKPYGCSVKYSR